MNLQALNFIHRPFKQQLVFLSVFFGLVVFSNSALGAKPANLDIQPPKVSEAKYKDFFRHRKKLENQNEKRLKGRQSQRERRKKMQQTYERARKNFVQNRKSEKQKRRDKKLDDWMQKKEKQEAKAYDQARRKYIRKTKNESQYVIPENKELGIQEPEEFKN